MRVKVLIGKTADRVVSRDGPMVVVIIEAKIRAHALVAPQAHAEVAPTDLFLQNTRARVGCLEGARAAEDRT